MNLGKHPGQALRTLAAACAVAAAAGLPTNGLAQSGRNSNVIIDYSVLDELGPAPAPSLPQLMQPGRQPQMPPAAAPRAPAAPSPVLRTAPPAPPPTAPGPIVLQSPADEAPPVTRPAAAPKRSIAKPAPSKRATAKKSTARPARATVARSGAARKSQTQTAARGPTPPPPEPKPHDIAAAAPPAMASSPATASSAEAWIAPRLPMALAPSAPVAAKAPAASAAPSSQSAGERRFMGEAPPPPPPAIPPPPEPAEVARVAPAAGAGTSGADQQPKTVTPNASAAKSSAAPLRAERVRPTRQDEAARPAVPPPPKFAEPTPARPESPPRQIAKAVGPANGTAVDSAATAPVGDQVRLAFASGANDLDDSARGKLDGVAHGLSQNPKLRLQLLAYAGGTSDAGSQARRLSLSRALSVRSYLIEKGVPSTRIDVRALGNKVEDGPPDRVDVVVTQR